MYSARREVRTITENEKRKARAKAMQEQEEIDEQNQEQEESGYDQNSMDLDEENEQEKEDKKRQQDRRDMNKQQEQDQDEDEPDGDEDEDDSGGEDEEPEDEQEQESQDKKEQNEQSKKEQEDANQDIENQNEDNNKQAEESQSQNKPDDTTSFNDDVGSSKGSQSKPEGAKPGGSESPQEPMGGSDFNPPPKSAKGAVGGAAKEAEAAEAGGTAAEGAAAGGAAAEGAAAGGAAAEGAAAGGAAAAEGGAAAVGGALSGTVAAVAAVVGMILLILFVVIGVAGFFTTVPEFLWNRLKQLAQSVWDGFQGYFIGIDESTINKDDVKGTAQYLYDMGYDLVGMGFAESVEIYGQKDENGNEIPVDEDHSKNEIKSIDAPYLRAYLIAENRTYIVNNYAFSLKQFATSFFDFSFFKEGMESWGSGMIDLDQNLIKSLAMPLFPQKVGEVVEGVKVERSKNTMRIRRINFELKFWKTHLDYTYFGLEGWTGRYGKPFELLYTLHIATMAPDFVKEFATDDDLDAKVHIKTKDTTFEGKVLVNGKTIDTLEAEGNYSEDTIKALRKLEEDNAEEIKTRIPYISSVTKHWFRNVYFEGTDSLDDDSALVNAFQGVKAFFFGEDQIAVGIDQNQDGVEDYNEATGVKTLKTRALTADDNVYKFGDEVEEEMEYMGDPIEGLSADDKITFKGHVLSGVVQTKDAVRGVTNPKTKELFQKQYYVYDGTVETAKKIQAARENNDDSIKQNIQFTKDSLQAFTILENSDTLDSQYIYRDLKELVIELGYFEKEDFYEIERQVLEWPIPDYIPGEWPDRKVEKDAIEYGTLIACDETMAKSLGISVEDLRKMTNTADNEDDNNQEQEQTDEEKYNSVLSGATFIGDEYMTAFQRNVNIDDAVYLAKEGATPQYWIDHIAQVKEDTNKIIIYLGLNNPTDYSAGMGLVDALLKRCQGATITVIEVMHVSPSYPDADALNKLIDTYNSHLREKCKATQGAKFINASSGLISGGYLADPDSTGKILADNKYKTFAKNIATGMTGKQDITSNATDETFVVKFLAAAKETTKYLKDNNFEYGNADFIPPKSDGSTTESGAKKITSDRMVAWALYKCGYTDQPETGLCVGKKGTFIEYCESKQWQKVDDVNEIQAGDIVFTGKLDSEGKKAENVFICAGDGQRYDCSSASKIATDQPIKETVGSNFLCAYRVTGDGVISTGFKADLPVTAMANGKVTQLLTAENNLFTDQALAASIYGTSEGTQADTEDGVTQSQEGIRIKLTDNALKGYVLVMYGFDVDESIAEGQTINVGDVIGKTLDSDICLILIDRDKAVVEDIENYIKVPKKTKNQSQDVDWNFYYWVPYESGGIGDKGIPTDKGAGACEKGTGAGNEVAVGIAQWTSLPGSCNNIPELCKWLYEQDSSLCAPLKTFTGYSASQVAANYRSLKDAWSRVNQTNTDKFLELQMKYFYEVEFTNWVKSDKVEWLLQKSMVAQGTYASLKNWGPNLGWKNVINSSMSDDQICKVLLKKACGIGSTAGNLSGRWTSQYALARDILNGSFTEVEEWVRTKQPGKYNEGKNRGSLSYIVERKIFRIDNQVYFADIKRKMLGGIYG